MLLASNEVKEVEEVEEVEEIPLPVLEDKKQHDLLENQNNLIKDLLDKQEAKEKELKEKEEEEIQRLEDERLELEKKEEEESEVYSLQYEQEQQLIEDQNQLLQDQNLLLEQTLEHIVQIENHNQSMIEISVLFIGIIVGLLVVKSFINTIFRGL